MHGRRSAVCQSVVRCVITLDYLLLYCSFSSCAVFIQDAGWIPCTLWKQPWPCLDPLVCWSWYLVPWCLGGRCQRALENRPQEGSNRRTGWRAMDGLLRLAGSVRWGERTAQSTVHTQQTRQQKPNRSSSSRTPSPSLSLALSPRRTRHRPRRGRLPSAVLVRGFSGLCPCLKVLRLLVVFYIIALQTY